jgi:hypothetical protein
MFGPCSEAKNLCIPFGRELTWIPPDGFPLRLSVRAAKEFNLEQHPNYDGVSPRAAPDPRFAHHFPRLCWRDAWHRSIGEFHHLFYACSHDISPANYDVRFVPRADIARINYSIWFCGTTPFDNRDGPFTRRGRKAWISDRSNKTLETKIGQGEFKGLRGGALVVHISQI